jgi:NitT/TauT family transport system permease protein
MQNNKSKEKAKLFTTLIFIYIVLFEFILPTNKFLPKPFLLFDSFVHVWKDYYLLYNVAATISIAYISMILGYVSIRVNYVTFFKLIDKYPGIIESIRIFVYVPVIVIIAIFYFWFEDHLLSEIIFSLLTSCIMIYNSVLENSKFMKEEYTVVAKNLGCAQSEIFDKVHWPALKPSLVQSLIGIHIRLFGLLLIFEFITDYLGLGHIIHSIIVYKDFTALFNVLIIILLFLFIGNSFLRFLKRKFFFWEM